MKLYIPGIGNAISFREQTVQCLVVENQGFLYALLNDLEAQLTRMDGKAVLSIRDTPVAMAKHMEMVTDFIRFELNQKALLGKIVSALDATAQNEVFLTRTQMLLSQLESYLYDISSAFDFNISFEAISMLPIIKASGIALTNDFSTLADKVYKYIEIVSEFLGEKLFVLVNLRSFLSDAQMQAFLDTVIRHGFLVLLIESTDRPRLTNETRITIDTDLCEF